MIYLHSTAAWRVDALVGVGLAASSSLTRDETDVDLFTDPRVVEVRVSDLVLDLAASVHGVDPSGAVHLATALLLGPSVTGFACADHHLRAAARANGLRAIGIPHLSLVFESRQTVE
ncbi:hypothetical protein [Saccharothrix violaceirubra]|uniref:PIN domain-containing protein n=1 Tax=Saccharothrix violaceirubra TaxID=413306 RepID=A0A7W7TB91_9PSEU|nr:hypothetical protein [Saccharothrix violaceirubra]MBB4969417.1 hypothetical protein [Saccharothrix violaceirubra]